MLDRLLVNARSMLAQSQVHARRSS